MYCGWLARQPSSHLYLKRLRRKKERETRKSKGLNSDESWKSKRERKKSPLSFLCKKVLKVSESPSICSQKAATKTG